MNDTTPTRSDVERFVVETLVELDVPRDDIALDAPLYDIGIDSLHIVEAGQLVKRDLGIDIRARDLHEAETLREVLDAIYAKAGL